MTETRMTETQIMTHQMGILSLDLLTNWLPLKTWQNRSTPEKRRKGIDFCDIKNKHMKNVSYCQ